MSTKSTEFKQLLRLSKRILVITGAGISAESGIPTFRGGSNALKWRNYEGSQLANLPTFLARPSLVWEFYHYRREICLRAQPNAAHLALAALESRDRRVDIITQNVDGLHWRAGSRNIVSIHGDLFETVCVACADVARNESSPICEALRERGDPSPPQDPPDIPVELLPRCGECGGLLRPNVVWFGERLRQLDLDRADQLVGECDLCLVIGTSAVVYPVATFPLAVIARGVPVVEFNTDKTPLSGKMALCFHGPCAEILPDLLLLE